MFRYGKSRCHELFAPTETLGGSNECTQKTIAPVEDLCGGARVVLLERGVAGGRRSDAGDATGFVHAGMLQLSHGLSTRPITGGIVAPDYGLPRQALRHRCFNGCANRARDQPVAACQLG